MKRIEKRVERLGLLVVLVLGMVLVLPCVAEGEGAIVAKVGGVGGVIEPGDRVLFIGDDLTQQMFYTRGVASALLLMMPDAGLRFFNGGWNGKTAGDALDWIDDLTGLTRPTVVFVCFGIARVEREGFGEAGVGSYREELGELVDRLKATEGVRRVVVLGPPAVQGGLGAWEDEEDPNIWLERMDGVARDEAESRGVLYVGLHKYMTSIYEEAERVGGEPLTIGGRLPTEVGHVVIASVVLSGIGADREEVEESGWSPLRAGDMRRIRQALALELEIPGYEEAESSRDVYLSLSGYDEAFFRQWRLAGRRPSGPTRQAMGLKVEQAWGRVMQMLDAVR